jgi:tRNA G18 (ribose-2'-O)-methylase SpoU
MILRIESPDDPRLAPYHHVGDHQRLRAEHLFVAEGRLVLTRLLEQRRFTPRSILVTPAALDAMADRLADAPCEVYVCGQATLDGITGFNFHRGCLALAEREAPATVDELLRQRLLLGLEGVGNPDNVGGLFRTASAFGVDAVLLDESSGDPLYRKAIRTSMAAALRVPFAFVPSWPAALERLRTEGWIAAALTPAERSVRLDDAVDLIAPDARLLLLVGAEGPGLGSATLAASDLRVRIPIAPDVDSLNVVVAAAVALHGFVSRRYTRPS